MRHALRRRYGRAAMAAGRVKWRPVASKLKGGNGYVAEGLWGTYRIRPPLPWSKGHALVWDNLYGYPHEGKMIGHELGSYPTVAAAKKAAQDHIKHLKSTAVG